MAHMHYKGTGKVHSFRGLLAEGEQQRIRIQGPLGAIAWRITKFEVMGNKPGISSSVESIVSIWREEQTSVATSAFEVNFDNEDLLATAIWAMGETTYNIDTAVVFDNALFSRNIWVTHTDNAAAEACNYYIELEEVKISAAGMAQLAVAAARRT